ncbi:MAG: sulfatase [Bacteroidales bacterium]|nr:sulfatase [Bacteroidales bacterium]
MKSTYFLPLLCLAASCSITEDKPNIVFILVDDLGYKDVGFMGSEFYETPNIDKLAAEGLVFTNAYTSAANSAPSRACLMTGQNTPSHGVYTVGNSDRGNSSFRKIIPVENTIFIEDNNITLADELQSNGYSTISIGKWHISEDPLRNGFNENVGGGKWGHPGSYFAPFKSPPIEDEEGAYLTDRLTKEAIKFIKRNRGNPFFLYLPYYAVHTPLQAKDKLVEKYKGKESSSCQNNAIYAAMIENMDSCIGEILLEIDKNKLSENTIIIFSSDNGGINAVSCQKPLRAGKGSYYEGGIRVPTIIKWENHIEEGQINDFPISQLDIYPTLLDIIGAEPEKNNLDGISLWPMISKGELLPLRPLIWHFPVYLQAYKPLKDDARDPLFRTRPGSAIRMGKWKLHEYFEDGGIELYNLVNDPGERINLADSMIEKRDELYQILNIWRQEHNAPIPSKLNPDYDCMLEKAEIERFGQRR